MSIIVVAAAVAWLSWVALPPAEIPNEIRSGSFLDMHVHAAGLGYGESQAFISAQLENSYKFEIYLSAFGVSLDELEVHGDRVLLEKLSANIRQSRFVNDAVILAMDGIINASGELDHAATQFYVPNDYLIRELRRFPNLHFGASVNPYRHDALDRLDHAAANGAVLMKWLPNIMLIDPADTRITPFYKRLVELELPLLTHTGAERSFGEASDEYGDPSRLSLPLSLGVTVIAAHIGTTGTNDGVPNFDRILPMFEQHSNLYSDISSLTQINKLNYLVRALETPGVASRLINGSDWPLQFFPLVSPFFHLNHISFREAKAVQPVTKSVGPGCTA